MRIITVDIGWGDSGKGSIVDYLTSEYSPLTEKPTAVVRYSGGHQCGHKVVSKDHKRSHIFSQFGSGTLNKVKTILTNHVIIEPISMIKEAEALSYMVNLPGLYIDRACPVTTPIHVMFNRAFEAINSNGTCGKGIGLTRLTDYHGLSVYLSDDKYTCYKKICRIRDFLSDYYYSKGGDHSTLSTLKVDISGWLDGLSHAKKQFESYNIHDDYEVLDCNLIHSNNLIYEAAQGIALNEYTGVYPEESTWGDVTTRNALEIDDIVYKNQDRLILGIMRSYATRHGGVLPSARKVSPEFESCGTQWDKLHFSDAGSFNTWQGTMYSYKWRPDVLNKLVKLSGCDGIAINHLDEYSYSDNEELFDSILNPKLECGVPFLIGGVGPSAFEKMNCARKPWSNRSLVLA